MFSFYELLFISVFRFSIFSPSIVSSFHCVGLANMFFQIFIYLFIFRERGREGEREGEKHQCARETSLVASHTSPAGTWPATQTCALTGN